MIHPIDNLFRKKLLQRNFEANEADWQGALDLLEAQDKSRNKKGLLFWWIFPAVAGLAVVWLLMTGYGQKTDTTPVFIPAAVNDQLPTVYEDAAPTAMSDFLTAEENISSNTSKDKKDIFLSASGREGGLPRAAVTSPPPAKLTDNIAVSMDVGYSKNTNIVPPDMNQADVFSYSTTRTSDLPLLPTLFPAAVSLSDNQNPSPASSPASGIKTIHPRWYAGLNLGANWLPANNFKSWLSGYQAAFDIGKHYNNRWGWRFTAIYAAISGDLDVTRQNEVVSYSFDRQVYERKLQPNSIHLVSGIWALNRSFGKHSILLGTGISHVIAVRGTFENNGTQVVQSDTLTYHKPMWMVRDGFKKWSVPVVAQWEYRITSPLSVRLGLGYRIGGIRDTAFDWPDSGAPSSKHALYIETGLRYHFKP